MSPISEPNKSTPPAPETQPDQSEAVTTTPNTSIITKFSGGKWLIWLLIIIILSAGGSFGYSWWHNHHKAIPTTTAVIKHDIPLIRYALTDGPANNFYPNADTTNGGFFINAQTFEGLVGYQDGTKIVPLLATGWTNPDDSTWVFTLRSSVKFHNGRTMTAADVKASIDKYKDSAYGGEFGSTIKSVDVMAPNQVKITTDGPDPILLHRLVYLDIVDSQSTKVNDAVNGTGAYTVKANTDPAKDPFVDLVAFDGYWGGHAYTRELQVSVLAKETDALPLLKDHKIDLVDNFVKTNDADAAKAVGATVTPDLSAIVSFIGLNTTIAPFNNLKLRQALDVGLDRSAILKANAEQGIPLDQFVVQSVPGFDPSITVPAVDVAKAKQLVADSGIKNPTFSIAYGGADIQDAVTEIQKEAAGFGVTVKLLPEPDFATLYDFATGGKAQAYILGYSSDLNDSSDMVVSVFQNKNYTSDSIAKLLTTANSQLNATQRIATLQQIARQLHTDVPAVAIGSRNDYYATTNPNYVLHRDLPTSTIGNYFWKVYQR